MTAIDISEPALEVARTNAQRHQVADRIEFLLSDLLAETPPAAQFDLIASNPPYVSQGEWEQLSAEVRDFEPALALVGGPTGSEMIGRLIPQAAERLRPGGWLMMEISPMTESAVRELLTQNGRFQCFRPSKTLPVCLGDQSPAVLTPTKKASCGNAAGRSRPWETRSVNQPIFDSANRTSPGIPVSCRPLV